MPSVGAKHIVAQAVAQQKAHRQIVHGGLLAQPHAQRERFADAKHLRWAVGVVRRHSHQPRPSVARAHADAALAHRCGGGFKGGVLALCHQRVVQVQHLIGRVVGDDAARVQQHRAVAQAFDGAGVVRDKHQRRSLRPKLADARIALVLKIHIAHRQRLVHDQHIRAQRRRHAEG